jgi:hypothetical protein
MKTKMPFLALGALMLGFSGANAGVMQAAGLQQAMPVAATQAYHRGKPHRRHVPRVRVYPRYYAGPAYATPYYYDDLSQYPYARGFEDRNPVARGNMRGCTVDLGYGRYESCDQ